MQLPATNLFIDHSQKGLCANVEHNQTGRLLPYPTNIVTHRKTSSARRWPRRFWDVVEISLFTHVDGSGTQHTHCRQHTACPLATRCLPSTDPRLHGLSRAPPWFGRKRYARPQTRRASPTTPPLDLKTTVACHPPSSADHQLSGPVTRGATAHAPKAFCPPQRGRHIVIGGCGQPRVGRTKSLVSLGLPVTLRVSLLLTVRPIHRLSAVTRPISFYQLFWLISWASLSPRYSVT